MTTLPDVMTIDRTKEITDEAARFASAVMNKQKDEKRPLPAPVITRPQLVIANPIDADLYGDLVDELPRIRALGCRLVAQRVNTNTPLSAQEQYLNMVAEVGMKAIIWHSDERPVVTADRVDLPSEPFLKALGGHKGLHAVVLIDEPRGHGDKAAVVRQVFNYASALPPIYAEQILGLSGELLTGVYGRKPFALASGMADAYSIGHLAWQRGAFNRERALQIKNESLPYLHLIDPAGKVYLNFQIFQAGDYDWPDSVEQWAGHLDEMIAPLPYQDGRTLVIDYVVLQSWGPTGTTGGRFLGDAEAAGHRAAVKERWV